MIDATYGPNCPLAIRLLVEFAAQNSGIDPRNYYDPQDRLAGRAQDYRDGLLDYRQEVRSIGNDWKRFKLALATAAAEGVTEAAIIEAAPRAFSGRLEWKSATLKPSDPVPLPASHWEYTTGQYFPTEYRKAAASVLEYAIRETRQARPPAIRKITSIKQLKALNEENGGCWFGAGEMRFFGTRIESEIIDGSFFITSEQPPHGPRKFTIRSFDSKGDIETVGQFCAFDSKHDALDALPQTENAA